MTTFKKPKLTKSKFMTEDLNDLLDTDFLNDSLKNNNVKRQVKIDKEFCSMSEIRAAPVKKQKIADDIDSSGELRQRTLNVMNRQLQIRKQIDDNFLKDITEVITNVETDHDALKDNVQKLEQLTACFMKCMQQTTAAHKEKLKAFKGVFASFKKECEEIDAVQRDETVKFGGELEEDLYKLKQKLISETKRNEREHLQKSFFQAMQNNF